MRTPRTDGVDTASFRDPSGFLFWKGGQLYRQVNRVYQEAYSHFIESGLYAALTNAGLIVSHKEVEAEPLLPSLAYRVIKPELIHFISYPYEWCFSQLKDAALATLAVQAMAMQHGMSLKDASAYNIQFRDGRPVFIDTLSFERYREGWPWVAYRQFCQHFLAPLALMSKRDIRLNQLLRVYIDGLPLDLTSKLLPRGTGFSFSLLTHIHLHAASQQKYAGKSIDLKGRRMSRIAFMGILDSLGSAIRGLHWQPAGTEWAEYYRDTNYTPAGFQDKKDIIARFLDKTQPSDVWDLGANDGTFSRLAGDRGIPTVSFDIDPAAVEKSYLECVKKRETRILPLVLDLANPSPAIGWGNEERLSLVERGSADTVMALALVHHLAISNNLPLAHIAKFFQSLCSRLIVEFVPKSDSQVQRLLSTRQDIFPDYSRQAFEREFRRYFTIEDSSEIRESQRTLYLMRRVP